MRTNIVKETKIKRFSNKNTLLSIISTAINKSMDIKAVVMNEYSQFYDSIELIENVAIKYHEYKERNFVMDFDDLLIKTKQLLEQHNDIRLSVATNNLFVMIDEYQDTNKIQAELAALFANVHGNIMAVGDNAQSIYSFRGADHKNIVEFTNLFPETKIIKLEENYRSTPQILNAANVILNQPKYKFDKQLFTKNDEGDLVGLVPAQSNHDQSRFITQAVLFMREQGVEFNNMAVLFRNGRDSFDLEVELK